MLIEKNQSNLNAEKRASLQSLQQVLHRFNLDKVDPMELYLLKSIALFKSDSKSLQDKMRVEQLQEECFVKLFAYARSNYPSYPRFGRLLILYSDLRKFAASKLVEEFFLRPSTQQSETSQQTSSGTSHIAAGNPFLNTSEYGANIYQLYQDLFRMQQQQQQQQHQIVSN